MKDTVLLVWAWIGLVAGVVVAGVVVVLFNSIIRPALEIKRYADDILNAGLGIARNLDGVDKALRTGELATAVPGLALDYLEKLGARP